MGADFNALEVGGAEHGVDVANGRRGVLEARKEGLEAGAEVVNMCGFGAKDFGQFFDAGKDFFAHLVVGEKVALELAAHEKEELLAEGGNEVFLGFVGVVVGFDNIINIAS